MVASESMAIKAKSVGFVMPNPTATSVAILSLGATLCVMRAIGG